MSAYRAIQLKSGAVPNAKRPDQFCQQSNCAWNKVYKNGLCFPHYWANNNKSYMTNYERGTK